MPAQIVVVKRPREGLFAALRRAPVWLRAVWQGEELAPSPQSATSPSSPTVARSELAPSMMPPPRRPAFRARTAGVDPCERCEACVRVCPSRALARTPQAANDASPALDLALVLDLGRCIGCGLCAEACPEAALELIDATPVAWAGSAGERLTVRLGEPCRA